MRLLRWIEAPKIFLIIASFKMAAQRIASQGHSGDSTTFSGIVSEQIEIKPIDLRIFTLVGSVVGRLSRARIRPQGDLIHNSFQLSPSEEGTGGLARSPIPLCAVGFFSRDL
jgi:hypothetical protein